MLSEKYHNFEGEFQKACEIIISGLKMIVDSRSIRLTPQNNHKKILSRTRLRLGIPYSEFSDNDED